MKEILFRGQTRRYGEKRLNVAGDKMPSNWVYGGICKGDGDHSIIYGSNAYPDLRICDKYAVYSDTIGQYTGIIDKNGKKLFEGDIIKFISEDGVEVIAVVTYDVNAMQFVFETKFSIYTLSDISSLFDNGKEERFEFIGNIFDNPELINFECEFN